MKNKSFGLDIGATTFKIVSLLKKPNGFFLESAITCQTPLKGMLSESPLDQEEISRVIRKVVEEAKINTPYTTVSLPESQVYTRIIEMPVLSDNELASAIYWEAEQHIPVPLTMVTLDWKVLKRPLNAVQDQKMTVLLVGAPTILIDKYERILSMSGLVISAIETEILSVVRALVRPSGDEKAETYINCLVVNIGAVTTSFAIVKNGIIVFAYSIPTGGIAINRAIATDFGFSINQAEEYKKVYGMSQDVLGGKISQTTMPIILSIVMEIKKALAFYTEKYKNEDPIRQIVLAGGTAKLPGLNSIFAQQCGIETITANPWNILANQDVPKEIIDNAPDYTIAVGLAMREYE